MNFVAECEITPEDYKTFVRVIRGRAIRSSGARFSPIFMAIPFGIALGLVGASTKGLAGDPSPWILGFVFGVAWLYVAAIINAASMRKRLEPTKDGYMLGPQHVELRPDGLHIRSKRHEARFEWSIVAPPIDEKEHLFVMVERAAAVIIPKRCFQSDEEKKAFAESVCSLAQHAPY